MHASELYSSLQPISKRFRELTVTIDKSTYLDLSSGSTPFLLYSSAVDCSSSNCFFVSFPIICVTTRSLKSKWVGSPPLGLLSPALIASAQSHVLLVLMLEHMSGVPLLSHPWHFLTSFTAEQAINILSATRFNQPDASVYPENQHLLF
jgi:hypothetical protein